MRRQLPITQVEERLDDVGRGNKVTFPTSEGNEQRTFDLDEVSVPADIKVALRYGIVNHPTPIAHHTQEQYWYSIKTFGRFAEQDGLRRAEDLNTKCIHRYQEWLTRQTIERTGTAWSDTYQGKKLISLREVVRTVKTGKPELLPSDIIFPRYLYPEGTPTRTRPRKHLTQGELKSLMWACQLEIQETNRRFETGKKVLTGAEEEPHPGMRHALLLAEKLGNGGTLTKIKLRKEGVKEQLIHDIGGMEGLRAHLGATSRTLIPFMISLLVQLAGNVDPVRRMKIDCARTDEIDERWAVIEWDKPRGKRLTREPQRRFGDRTKRYGAPALIAMVIALTRPTRELVDSDDADKLFICEGMTKTYGLLTYDRVKDTAQRFLDDSREKIARWNERHPRRAKKQIGKFDLSDIRGSVAVQHYLASRGDIRRPQQVLNHQDSQLTGRYIEGKESTDRNAQIISKVQSQIVELATGHPSRGGRRPYTKENAGRQPKTATAAFTHECRAPMGNSKKLCSHFQQCLDCPGLVIPKTPESLARLLQAEATFRAAKERLDPERWQWLYARSYATLTQRILPEFPHDMMDSARQLKDALPPLPDLE